MGYQLFVGSISPGITNAQLLALFAAISPVQKIIRESNAQGQLAGFGYVEYNELQHVVWALEYLNGVQLPAQTPRGINKALLVKVDAKLQSALSTFKGRAGKNKFKNDPEQMRMRLNRVVDNLKKESGDETNKNSLLAGLGGFYNKELGALVPTRLQDLDAREIPESQRGLITGSIAQFRQSAVQVGKLTNATVQARDREETSSKPNQDRSNQLDRQDRTSQEQVKTATIKKDKELTFAQLRDMDEEKEATRQEKRTAELTAKADQKYKELLKMEQDLDESIAHYRVKKEKELQDFQVRLKELSSHGVEDVRDPYAEDFYKNRAHWIRKRSSFKKEEEEADERDRDRERKESRNGNGSEAIAPPEEVKVKRRRFDQAPANETPKEPESYNRSTSRDQSGDLSRPDSQVMIKTNGTPKESDIITDQSTSKSLSHHMEKTLLPIISREIAARLGEVDQDLLETIKEAILAQITAEELLVVLQEVFDDAENFIDAIWTQIETSRLSSVFAFLAPS